MFSLMRGLLTAIYALVYGGLLLIFLFLLLCMNVFTLPISLILWLICALFKLRRPRLRFYGLMVYPSWRAKPRFTLSGTMEKWSARQRRKTSAKQRRSFNVTRAWEERFF